MACSQISSPLESCLFKRVGERVAAGGERLPVARWRARRQEAPSSMWTELAPPGDAARHTQGIRQHLPPTSTPTSNISRPIGRKIRQLLAYISPTYSTVLYTVLSCIQ